MPKEPLAKDQDKFVLRLPDGMRERIKLSADRNGRSMNAEIIQALEQMFPPEPSVEDLLDRVHSAIDMATGTNIPYRGVLIDALDKLSERISSGIEFDQFQSRTVPPSGVGLDNLMARMDRWRRASKVGVEQADLERELSRGLVRRGGGGTVHTAIDLFKSGKPERALKLLRLDNVKFAEPEKAYAAIEQDLRSYFEENWGNPDDPWLPDD